MSVVFSNRWLARVPLALAYAAGSLTFAEVGLERPIDQPARLSEPVAAAVSYTVGVAVFYLLFGLLSLHWFGWRYWPVAAVWGLLWLGLVAMLNEGLVYVAAIASYVATSMLIGRVAPDGGIDTPRIGGPR